MKKLLHYTARAWMFILKQLKGSHFAIPTTRDFKRKIKQFNQHFASIPRTTLKTRSWDISGCYTNMPKNEILDAMKNVLHMVKGDPDMSTLHNDDIHVNMIFSVMRIILMSF